MITGIVLNLITSCSIRIDYLRINIPVIVALFFGYFNVLTDMFCVKEIMLFAMKHNSETASVFFNSEH